MPLSIPVEFTHVGFVLVLKYFHLCERQGIVKHEALHLCAESQRLSSVLRRKYRFHGILDTSICQI